MDSGPKELEGGDPLDSLAIDEEGEVGDCVLSVINNQFFGFRGVECQIIGLTPPH